MEQTTTIHDSLAALCAQLDDWSGRTPLPGVTEQLAEIAQAARDASRPDLGDFVDLFGTLVDLTWQLGETHDDDRNIVALREFLRDAQRCLAAALNDEPGATGWMAELQRQASECWGECLAMVRCGELELRVSSDWESDLAADSPAQFVPVDSQQIGLILSSLRTGGVTQSGSTRNSVGAVEGSFVDRAAAHAHHTVNEVTEGQLQAVALDDPEIREAFLDDAQRGLSAIEACLMAYEASPGNSQPLQQVCRELHTLKGASASVGLEQLASFLHRVEDDLQQTCDQDQTADLQPIFQAVDAVRAQVSCCLEPAAKPTFTEINPSATAVTERFSDNSASHDSVRVKSAQLDRLMDMLAELVMLRNRRESRVEQLKAVHSELVHCVSRLRAYEENYSAAVMAGGVGNHGNEHSHSRQQAVKQRVSSLTEIANDVLEIGGSLRELYEPVSDENRAMSRFIRTFRQELIQLRRVPIAGLFQRLQRAARDAARVEDKQVRLQVVGEQVGLETALQQQLYEPLLHIVRNAVSHGIETAERRGERGKPATGTVTLEAHGSANMLVVTVRDDGRGLDYDALRRRGLEMGLISADHATSRAELARLIFHPGFSTRTDASEISGRGVGMDVVAAALARLHGWIEVDSEPGQGSSVRLLIPLHSVIEHVMVFRSGRQEFAIPTQYIKFAGDPHSIDTSEFPLTRLSRLFGNLDPMESDLPQLVVIARAGQAGDGSLEATSEAGLSACEEQRLGILIDEIIGPEEVVVRPLPSLLARQPFLSGVTLSGSGDIMLIFDSQQLLRRGLERTRGVSVIRDQDLAPPVIRSRSRRRVLVVDDSRSSRRALIRSLGDFDFDFDEASDGLEALRRLKETSYDLIFTDLEMPQLNGMELLREIRTGKRTMDVPIVMVTSRGEDEFRQEARRLGANDYLTKPVSEAVVTQAIERLQNQQERSSE